ncbi:hypothetical protein [Providencia burhodogranariea]|uniref:Uncharacterized protein n=1 Tax=Providencia burhodogranariea DSM 19968 TaxID=1141662 RepID=K8WPC5_9GAMM|nr:hypothetical protein [Providencia burhodogranariea]EKT61816.1 hypothetical protein OOA_09438 [Providencia burhodogranariea DSM 19968]
MKISNTNFDNAIITTQTSQPSLEKSYQEINKLTRTINAINNNIHIYYNKPIAIKEDIINNKHNILIKVNKFITEHDENSIVRFKNGKFKLGKPNGFLKNIFHGARYQAERAAAAKIANINVGKTSASQIRDSLNTGIINMKYEISLLNDEKEELQTKINKIELKLDIV